MIVDINKKYRVVGTHEPVRVICVDRKDKDVPCMGLYLKDGREWPVVFNLKGEHYGIPYVEEIPSVDWSKVAVDTPIWVADRGPRHFEKYDPDKHLVYFYADGKTSHTFEGVLLGAKVENCSLEAPK